MKIFVGSNYTKSDGSPIIRAELIPTVVKDFEDFYNKFFKSAMKGAKHEHYVTIAKEVETTKGDPASKVEYRRIDHYHRNDQSQITAQFIAYDGDASKSDPDSCIPMSKIKSALDKLGYRYILYTTHSQSGIKHRWRLFIPCLLNHKAKLAPTMLKLFSELEKLCPDLKWTNESKTFSQPWYLALRDDPDDGFYESYFNDVGRDFEACDASISNETRPSETLPSSTEADMLEVLIKGTHPLHEVMNKYIYGRIRDGMKPGAVKSHLHAFSSSWDMSDERLKSRKNDIDRLVDQFMKKNAENSTDVLWERPEGLAKDRIYTHYPDFGGNFEKMVQECMQWMIFPNRQIAVTAVRGLISAMGARVYTLPDGKGINLTALITGRSTIGKSNVKKFFIWVLDSIMLNKLSQFYLGAQHYTSPKNLVDDLREKVSLYSVRTESGQSDKSSAGDMPRVMNYELEFATEGGQAGYVSRGGQNRTAKGDETLPALFSPPVTTIRESVAKIQNDADVLNQSTVAGVTGRRSVVLIDPVKAKRNYERRPKPSDMFKEFIKSLHKMAADPRRKDCTKQMEDKLWNIVMSEDETFLRTREDLWLEKENKAAAAGDNLESTFYGRLYERVPAFAAALAIADDPLAPLISNQQYLLAEKSLYNEFCTSREQSTDGSLMGHWGVIEKKLVDIFSGDMTRHITRYDKRLHKIAQKELEAGCIEWTPLSRILQHMDAYVVAKGERGFSREFEDRASSANIEKMAVFKTTEQFGHKRTIYKRI